MLYSGTLLKRYLSLSTDSETIAQELTLKTCEIEEHIQRNIPEKVVIGRVTSVTPHPNADKLVVCQVDCGDKGQRQVCTGGENVTAGSFVPFALTGCHLPAINLTIESRELRGEESNGMICSKEELGIPEDVEEHWIWNLQYDQATKSADIDQPADFDDISSEDLGTPLADKYPRLDNWMLDVENKTITHRPDLFGHFGLSIELHTIFDSSDASFATGKKHMEQLREGSILETLSNADATKQELNIQSDKTYTYTLIELDDITVTRSDLYLRLALHDLGLQPKNNWIDFSNLFMYLTGQPVHFFDADSIEGDITVREAHEGEEFTDLFDETHTLTQEDIVICDENGIIALAGVVGAKGTGVSEDTSRIFVEIANFAPLTVRKTGTRCGRRTDAEIRFEKAINPLFSLHAVQFFFDELDYFKKSLGSYTSKGLTWRVNDHAEVQVKQDIDISFDRIQKAIGISDDNFAEKAEEILTDLGFTLDDEAVTAPVWRSPTDCTREADIVEEVARIYGYDKIPEATYEDTLQFVPFDEHVTTQRSVETYLTGTGQFDQVETYPRLHTRWIEWGDLATDDLFQVANPLRPERSFLRNTMIWSMVELLEKNAPFFDQLHLFDIGTTRDKKRKQPEHTTLGLGVWYKDVDDWEESPFLVLKGHLDGMLQELGYSKWELDATDRPYFHPRQQASIRVDGNEVGHIAVLHPYWAEKAKLPPEPPFVIAELDLTDIQDQQSHSSRYETLQDQVVWRDLNFVIDKDQNYDLVTNALTAIDQIQQVDLFDLYGGDNLPKDQKSIGVRIKIKGDGEMEAEQINTVMDQAIKSVEQAGGKLRE